MALIDPSPFKNRSVSFLFPLFMYVHEVLVSHLGGLSLPRKSVVRLTDRPDMTLDVYRGRKTTMQLFKNGWESKIASLTKNCDIIFISSHASNRCRYTCITSFRRCFTRQYFVVKGTVMKYEILVQ